MSDGRLRLCLVGLGRAGTIHLEALAGLTDSIELVAVVDEMAGRADEVAARLGVTSYRSLAEALADERVEAVDICLPHDVHRQAVVTAAAAGKHIVVEKPMALTTAEADAMVAAADQAGVVLMVGQSRRFFPAALESQRLAASGAIGRILRVNVCYLGLMEQPQADWWRSAARAGGLMLSLWGSHVLDYVIWLVGCKPRRVYAETLNNNPQWEGEDEVAAILAFPGDTLASVNLSWNARVGHMSGPVSADWGATGFYYERHIVGSEGTLVLVDETQLFMNGRPVPLAEGTADNFRAELLEFATAIRDGRQPIASGREVRAVVETMEACRISAAEHRVVTLEE